MVADFSVDYDFDRGGSEEVFTTEDTEGHRGGEEGEKMGNLAQRRAEKRRDERRRVEKWK